MHLNPFRFIPLPAARVVALDCGAGQVACAEFVRGEGGRVRLQRFERETWSPDPAQGARWLEFTGAGLAGIAVRKKIRGACRLVLPGHQTLTKFVRTPAAEPARRARIVEFEAQQSIPCPLAELVWDHLCVADDGTELELMLAAAKRAVVEPTCVTAAVAGFPVSQILPAPLALLRAFHYNYPEVGEDSLVVSIGARSTHVVLAGGGRFFARTIALGGNAITQAVADELRLDFVSAEALKLRVLGGQGAAETAPAAAETVRLAATRFVGRLQLELMRSTARAGPEGAAT